MSSNPSYVGTIKNGALCRISTANPNRDGTGTLGTVTTAGANGARIDVLRLQAIASTTAGMIRLFVSNPAGSLIRMVAEIPVDAVTVTLPSDKCWGDNYYFPAGFALEAGNILKASTHNGETFDIVPTFGGDI